MVITNNYLIYTNRIKKRKHLLTMPLLEPPRICKHGNNFTPALAYAVLTASEGI